MLRIAPLDDAQVVAWEEKLEAQMVTSLQAVMDQIAARIAKIQVASAWLDSARIEVDIPLRALIAAVTTGPDGDDLPPEMTGELAIPDPPILPEAIPETPALPPGQPYISPDDLASIAPLWQQQVAEQLLPLVAQVFIDSAGNIHSQLLDAGPRGGLALPRLGSLAAEQYLRGVQDTFDDIGGNLWETARAQMAEGFEAGESIPQIADRLRQSAGLTARQGVLVARTSVIEASNYGSLAMARVTGLEMQKEWIATPDLRTRPTHLEADGQRVALAEKFTVGGHSADFPADPDLPPSERYRCRCTIGYVMPDQPKEVEPPTTQQLDELPGTSGIDDLAADQSARLQAVIDETHAQAEAVIEDVHRRFRERFGTSATRPTVRASLAEARTLREVDQAAMTEARQLTGRDIRFDQTGSDVQIAREHAEGILRGLERYPESPISQVGTFGPGSSAEAITRRLGVPDFDEPRAFTATLPGNDVVLFNARMAGDPEAYAEALARGHGAGWHAQGTATPMGQALHEFGHTVDETFTEAGAKVGAVRSQMTVPFTGKAYKEAVRTEVSRYAATSTHELGGEAFADVMINGERASATSRAVFDAIERGYVKVHPRAGGELLPKDSGPGFDLPARGEGVPASYVRPSLQAAKTPRELRRVWQSEVEQITGFPFIVDAMPRGISMVTAREYAEGTLQMFTQFPGARVDRIHWFDDAASSSYAQVRRGGHAIEFNMRYASEAGRPKFLAARRKDAAGWDTGATSWGVRNDMSGQGVVYHEFTHILDIENTREAVHGSIVPLLIQHAQRDGITDIDDLIKRQISSYATKNYQEMVAEAGADVMVNGAAASQLSRDIFGLLRAEYRRRGFEIRTGPALPEELGEAFPKTAAPRALSSQTVAQLRALAKERGITVPPGTRKADLVKMLEEAPPAPTIMPAAIVEAPPLSRAPLAYQARQAELREAAARPVLEGKSRRQSGQNAYVTRVEHQGGPPTITKDYTRQNETLAQGKRSADAEELGALVDDAVGLRAPTVIRTGPRIEESFLEGQSGEEILPWPHTVTDELIGSDDGRLIGLSDILVGESDRNAGNFIRLADGRLASIDRGGAFQAPKLAGAQSPFAEIFAPEGKWAKVIDINPADLAVIRARLEALRPEFERLGRATWHRQVMARLAEVEKRADPAAAIRLAEARSGLRAITAPAGRIEIPVSAAVKSYDTRAGRLRELYREKPISETSLSGGHISTADMVTTREGRFVVKDSIPKREGGPVSFSGRTAEQLTDAEVLGSEVFDAVGARAPAAIKISEQRSAQEFIEGRSGTEVALGRKTIDTDADQAVVNETAARLAETDEGRLRGLAQAILGDGDSNSSNWIVDADGHLWSIDHGGASFAEDSYYGLSNAWTRQFLDQAKRDGTFAEHSLSPGDMAIIRDRLARLESKFAELGRQDWFAAVMRRVDALSEKATGTRSILVEARPDIATPAVLRGLQRAEIRARAAAVAAQRGNAALLARVDELIQAKASKAVIRQELDPALREAEQLYAGADDATADALRAAVDSGDAAKIRAALTRQSKASGLTPIGKAGAKAKFDPATMEGVGGTAIPDGADVIVVRRGAKLAGIETPERAVVRLARAPSTEKTVAKGDFAGLTRTSEALGGNPGGIFEAGDGSRWYVKAAAGDEQARSEALALDLYRAAGLDAPELVIGEGVEGLGTGQVATRFLDDAQVDLRARLANDPAYIAEVQDGFAVDAWLANWDVVGANPAADRGWDNIVSVAGRPVRIEAGGALRFRGLGGEKAFGGDVLEFDTLRDKAAGRRTGAVFGDMTPEQIIASAERVRKVTPTKIKALVKKHGLDPELADTLIARRADILRRAELLAGPKPLTPREYAAKINAAAKKQEALDAVPSGLGEHFEDLAPAQQRAIISYQGTGFESVNDSLRGIERGSAYDGRQIHSLDEAMNLSRLDRDIELWRSPGSGRGIFGDPNTWDDDLSGFEWRDDAYSSTSAAQSVADRFNKDGGVRLRILTPRGTKAIRLSDMPTAGLTGGESAEAEVLLGRGARYRVVKDRGWTEITHPTTHQKIRVRDLDVEVIVPDETPPLPWETK